MQTPNSQPLEDPRKTKLRQGLSQLNNTQLRRLLATPEQELVTDTYFYDSGRY